MSRIREPKAAQDTLTAVLDLIARRQHVEVYDAKTGRTSFRVPWWEQGRLMRLFATAEKLDQASQLIRPAIDWEPADDGISGGPGPYARGQGDENSPVGKVIGALTSEVSGPKWSANYGNVWRARCPAHAGKSANSLAIGEFPSGSCWVKCWSGCPTKDIVSVLNLKPVDLVPMAERWSTNGAKPAKPSGNTKLHSALDLTGMEMPEIHWAVPALLPEGLALEIGKPKAGKSWLNYQLGVAIASGTPFLGMATIQGDVLYVAYEDSRRRAKGRLLRVLGGSGAPAGLDVVTVEDGWGRADDEGVHPLILKWLDRHPNARLVIIDTLGRYRSLNMNRNAYLADVQALEALQREAIGRRVTIEVTHHDNKNLANEDWVYSISGTQGVAGTADTLVGLARRAGSDLALLKVHGRDLEERMLILRFLNGMRRVGSRLIPGFGWQAIGEALPGGKLETSEKDMVVKLLDDARFQVDKTLGVSEVARHFPEDSYDQIRMRLVRMAETGLIERDGNRYFLRDLFDPFGTFDPFNPSDRTGNGQRPGPSDPTEQTEQTEQTECTEQEFTSSSGGIPQSDRKCQKHLAILCEEGWCFRGRHYPGKEGP